VYNADARARWLMENDPALKQDLLRAFGAKVFHGSRLNRTWLAAEVFSNAELLRKVNTLVHPRVAGDFKSWKNRHKASAYTIKEAALLIESGSYRTLDKIILVVAPEKVRIARVLERDPHRDAVQVRDIMQKQLPDREKEKYADYILRNDDSGLLIPQIIRLHTLFAEKGKE
jgi:dephospho-CoA kinase